MNKEIGYIKIGSYGGYKIYKNELTGDITIWQIGMKEIILPAEIAKTVLRGIKALL